MPRILICLFLFVCSASFAQDWARWRGPDNTGAVPANVAVPTGLPDPLKEVWRVPIGYGNSSPVVSGGKVFYLDNLQEKETAHAADAATGNVIWSVTLDDAFKDQQSPSGPRCTPVVDGDRVYVQSLKGEFQCLNSASGKLIWGCNFSKDYGAVFIGEKGDAVGAARHGNTGSPTVDGERILVQVGGPNGASVVCFNKRNGKVIWKSQNDVPGYAPPVIATLGGVKQVISFTAEAVIGLDDKTGSLLWRYPIKTAYGRHAVTPVVVDDMVMVSSNNAGLMGLKINKTSAGFTATRVWGTKQYTLNYASPVAVGKFLFGLGPMNTLFCVDIKTGEKAWAEERFFSEMVNTEYASFMVMHNNLLILTDMGKLLMVAADPKGLKLISKVTACGKNWCYPAYAGGRLYLRDDKNLYCLQLL